MKILPSMTLAMTLGLGSACQNSHPAQDSSPQPCVSQKEAQPEAPHGISPEDRVLAQSVLIQNDINYFRRELIAKFGAVQATDIYYGCMDEKCSEEASDLSSLLYKKVSKREMDLCFQGGDINEECMDGTILRRFGQEYLSYMETKNGCGKILATCLDRVVNPQIQDEPYDTQGIDPLDPWKREIEEEERRRGEK